MRQKFKLDFNSINEWKSLLNGDNKFLLCAIFSVKLSTFLTDIRKWNQSLRIFTENCIILLPHESAGLNGASLNHQFTFENDGNKLN
jgi:hypothetical protein